MTKLSLKPVDPRHMGWFINNFWIVLTLFDNKEQIRGFLKDLLTHTELKMLAKRLQIAKMLIEGYDYQTIRSYVQVTDVTISKINNILNTNGVGYKKAIKNLQQLEREIKRKWEESGKPGSLRKYSSVRLLDTVGSLIEDTIKKRRRRKSVYICI